MSQKDYIKLAACFAATRPTGPCLFLWRELREKFMQVMQENPRFDRSRFIEASEEEQC